MKNWDSHRNLRKELLIRWIVDTLWRTLVHYGYWLKEVEYQYGMDVALEMEKEVGETSMAIQLKRIAKLLKIELHNGIPAVLYRMDEKQLEELLDALSLNWLANDGVWFQAVEKKFGILDAKRCNDTCWTRFSPYEAYHIKTLLGLPRTGWLGGSQKGAPIPFICPHQQTRNCGRKIRLLCLSHDRLPSPGFPQA